MLDELLVVSKRVQEEADLLLDIFVGTLVEVHQARKRTAERRKKNPLEIEQFHDLLHGKIGVEHSLNVRKTSVGGGLDVVHESHPPPLVEVDQELKIATRQVNQDDNVDAWWTVIDRPSLAFCALSFRGCGFTLGGRGALSFRCRTFAFDGLALALGGFALWCLRFLGILGLSRLAIFDILPAPAQELASRVLDDVPSMFDAAERGSLRVTLQHEDGAVTAGIEEIGDGGPEVTLGRQFVKGASGNLLPLRMLAKSFARMKRHWCEGEDLRLDAHVVPGPGLEHVLSESDEVTVVLLFEVGMHSVDSSQLLESRVSGPHAHHAASGFRRCQPKQPVDALEGRLLDVRDFGKRLHKRGDHIVVESSEARSQLGHGRLLGALASSIDRRKLAKISLDLLLNVSEQAGALHHLLLETIE
mmetsp:Transcript_29867/g.58363  ORF Transcript_29867/g.58363 Transcript_29867/m.58363 type:complete len:416 (-) Transcript_29867:3763-5010(-)